MIVEFLLIDAQHADAPHRIWEMPIPPNVGDSVQFDPGEDAQEFKVVSRRFYEFAAPANDRPGTPGAEVIVEPIAISRPASADQKQGGLF